MKKRIIREMVDLPLEVNRFVMDRFAELLAPIRHTFVEAGLAGRSFTETAPDMPWKRLNYSFDTDGTWKFDWGSDKNTGETLITYVSVQEGHRSLVDINYSYMGALLKGLFKITPTAEHALRMAPMMPYMIECHNQAISEAEEKFQIVMPKWRYVGDRKSAQTRIIEFFLRPSFWKMVMKLRLWKLAGIR